MAQLAFEYLEIRHCIFEEVDGEIHSFTDEAEFEQTRSRLASDDARFTTAWTIYGRYIDEAGQLLALAIGDFIEKADAFTVMNAILAPMAKARDAIDEHLADRADLDSVVDASRVLTDFICQSSNHERL